MRRITDSEQLAAKRVARLVVRPGSCVESASVVAILSPSDMFAPHSRISTWPDDDMMKKCVLFKSQPYISATVIGVDAGGDVEIAEVKSVRSQNRQPQEAQTSCDEPRLGAQQLSHWESPLCSREHSTAKCGSYSQAETTP